MYEELNDDVSFPKLRHFFAVNFSIDFYGDDDVLDNSWEQLVNFVRGIEW